MPNMTGLDLCYKLQDFPFKKILLTGEMQHEEAVKAFNAGLIDRFIRKYDPDLFSVLKTHIKILERQYFCGIPADFATDWVLFSSV